MPLGPRIAPRSRVTLHLALSLTDGTEVLSTFGEEPVTAVMGDGTLDRGIELALYALRPGDTEHITLQAGQAYGTRDPSLVRSLARSSFAEAPQPGQVIAFKAANGEELPGLVLEVGTETVSVDFNHPLAGREVVLRAEILAVEPPPPGESE